MYCSWQLPQWFTHECAFHATLQTSCQVISSCRECSPGIKAVGLSLCSCRRTHEHVVFSEVDIVPRGREVSAFRYYERAKRLLQMLSLVRPPAHSCSLLPVEAYRHSRFALTRISAVLALWNDLCAIAEFTRCRQPAFAQTTSNVMRSLAAL